MQFYKHLWLVFLLLPILLKAQIPAYQWAAVSGGRSSDLMLSSATDKNGNTYLGGFFLDTSDLDPGAAVLSFASQGDRDIFIQKLDANGLLSWAYTFGSANYEDLIATRTDTFGNVYIMGFYSDSIDFDPGVGVSKLYALTQGSSYLVKLNANGTFAWAINLANSQNINYSSFHVDYNGQIYLGGTFQGSVDFDPGVGTLTKISQGLDDCFVQILNNSGGIIAVEQLGGTGNMQIRNLRIDAGRLLLTGSYSGSPDFDPGVGQQIINAANSGEYILLLDANAQFVWVRGLESGSSKVINDATMDAAGNIVVVGQFWDGLDFDPGVGDYTIFAANFAASFILKLDINGNFIWVKQTGYQGWEVEADRLGNWYVLGDFQVNTDLDPGVGVLNVTTNQSGGYLIKLSSNGTFNWGRAFVGDQNQALCLGLDQYENLYIGGVISGLVDLNPGIGVNNFNTAGISDIMAIKLGTPICTGLPSYDTISISACNSYISPSGDYEWTASGVYSDIIFNISGCDSIIQINLTVTTVDTSVSRVGNNLSSNLVGAVYQWVNCDLGNAPINGATNQSYLPNQNGNYAVQISYNGCNVSSACHPVIFCTNPQVTDSISVVVCNSSYLSPSGNYLWTSSGSYVDTVQIALGCDSIITIDLTVLNIDTTLSITAFSLSANALGADSYQWVDCNIGNQPIIGATSRVFNPTSSGNYAVLITQNGCTVSSACQQITVGACTSFTANFTLAQSVPFEVAIQPFINGSQATNNVSIYWNFGDNSPILQQSPLDSIAHQYTNFGTYELCMTVVDSTISCAYTYCDTLVLDSSGVVLRGATGFGASVLPAIFNPTSITETASTSVVQNISLFPNPGSVHLNVVLSKQEASFDLQILDINGRLMSVSTFNGSSNPTLDIQQLIPGLYYIRYLSKTATVTKPFVKI